MNGYGTRIGNISIVKYSYVKSKLRHYGVKTDPGNATGT